MSEKTYRPLIMAFLEVMTELRLVRAPIVDSFGLTSPCIAIIAALYRFGELTRSELALKVGLGTNALGRPLDRLVKLKLVERKSDPDNRRFIKLSLTAAGLKIAKSYRSQMSKVWKRACKNMQEEEVQGFIKSLNKISSELKKSRDEA